MLLYGIIRLSQLKGGGEVLKDLYTYIAKAYKSMKIAKYLEHVLGALKDFFF